MIDRTTLDLRFDAHARMAKAINGAGWQQVAVIPMPRPRATLATLLLALAARLAPEPIALPETRRMAQPDAIA